MTEEDLQQIRQIVTEIVTRIVSVKLDRAVESMANDFSELRAEMTRRFDQVHARLEAVENGLARLEARMAATALELAAIHKVLDAAERSTQQSISTQAAQQRAIDELYARIKALEARLEPPQ